jgi:uncharacterized Rmd1/YagE family protein
MRGTGTRDRFIHVLCFSVHEPFAESDANMLDAAVECPLESLEVISTRVHMIQQRTDVSHTVAAAPEPVLHSFHAVALVDSVALRELAFAYPDGKRVGHRLQSVRPYGGRMFVYRFGAIVFHNVSPEGREAELARLRKVLGETAPARIIEQSFEVREDERCEPRMSDGGLTLDRMGPERANAIATTIAQSVAMEHYECMVEEMCERTDHLVSRMERTGTVGFAIRPLHRFIGRAAGTRNQVLSVLHLLDGTDEVGSDDRFHSIHEELRTEFDLKQRYQSIELKLENVKNAVELILGVARDRRLVLLELTIALLILFEIGLAVLG